MDWDRQEVVRWRRLEGKVGNFRHVPYRDRTDEQKLLTQWGKAHGLLNRRDWSAAVVRAVTATEISANLAIRAEYQLRGGPPREEVDKILIDANGLWGKIAVLVDLVDEPKKAHVKSLKPLAKAVYKKRNAIVHSGEFCDEPEARAHVLSCGEFVAGVVVLYQPTFQLRLIPKAIRQGTDPGA